jgi:hypothetical protein
VDGFLDNDFEIHIEHKIFLRDDQSSVNWLENFLKLNDFSKLWIKVFVMDGYYANLLKNSQSRDVIRVLQDNTKTRYSTSTPYENLLNYFSCTLESFEDKFFPMRSGTLHNKYILFEKKSKDQIEMGYISGSYNLTKSANSKDNDLIYFSIKSKNKGWPGQIQGFNRPIDKAFITNYTKLLYDFTESWQIHNKELICPNCSSTEIDYAFYCLKMTSRSGYIHLFDIGGKQAVPKLKFPWKRSSIKPLNQELRPSIFIFGTFGTACKGTYHECERCPFWCNEPEFLGEVLLKDLEGNSHSLFSCVDCNAIFTENGGLIGDMIPYITLSSEIPTLEEFDDDEDGVYQELNKKNITLNWSEDYDI